jgi:isopenicillin-N epimerase
MTPRTRLLLCSHITTRTGLIAPIRGLADLAHTHGARLVVDGAHAPGMIPLDLREAGCDYYGGNCHKWLCAPKGVGFLYAAPGAQEDLHHLVVSWGYDPKGPSVGPEGRALTGNGPHMWAIEHWGTSTMPEQEATGEAVALQVAIGPERIAARGRQLAAYIRERIGELPGSRLLSPVHPDMTGSISTFHLQGFDHLELGKTLFDRFHITVPVYREKTGNVLRVSTHIYNTFDHCDLLVDALQTLRMPQAPSSR